MTPCLTCPHSAQLPGSTLTRTTTPTWLECVRCGLEIWRPDRGRKRWPSWPGWELLLEATAHPQFLPLSPSTLTLATLPPACVPIFAGPAHPLPASVPLPTNPCPGYLQKRKSHHLTTVILILLSVNLRINSDFVDLQGWALGPQGANEVWGS